MKKNKIVNRLFAMLMAGIVAAPFGMMSVEANNHTDKPYSRYYNGNGGDVSTGYDLKTDDSYVYIRHDGDVETLVSIRVEGYTGNYTGMYGSGSYVAVPLGQGYKITNYVAESFRDDYNRGNYKYIRLQLMPRTHSPARLHGVWSADSI